MDTPNFSQDQYVDATSMDSAFNAVSGSVALGMSSTQFAGLTSPTAAVISATGLAVQLTLPAPFGVLFGNGAYAQAHGNTNGSDTQTYNINFSGVVPVSGSVTAYCLLAQSQVSQTPVAITGPPPGHPDYNPNFIPYTAYRDIVDTLTITATSGVPDDITTFELFRTTLAAGATGIGVPDTSKQVVRGPHMVYQIVSPASGVTMARERHNVIVASGTFYLPYSATSIGTFLTATAIASGVTISASGANDFIYGVGTPGAMTVPLFANNSLTFAAISSGHWQVISSTQTRQLVNTNVTLYATPTGSDSTGNGTSGNPFATPSKAYSYAQAAYDLAGQYTLTINCSGAFTAGVECNGPVVGLLGPQSVLFEFVGGSSLIVTNNNAFICQGGAQATIDTISGTNVLVGTSGSLAGLGDSVLAYGTGANVAVGKVNFGNCYAFQAGASTGGNIGFQNSYTISGSAQGHYVIDGGAYLIVSPTITVTTVGTPNFTTAFAITLGPGEINCQGVIFAGTGATGVRYTAGGNGIIKTGGGGANYFPGNSPGTVNLVGGVYGNGSGQYT